MPLFSCNISNNAMSDTQSSRAETAAKIASNPSNYKVCEGCDSIVGISTAICPNCHSFRFDAEADTVISQAVLLGSREQRSVTSDDLS
ncbi:MAG: hypothetical protein NWR51_04110 [Akkermansiaceae bacterium]|nr:hypothetical protein [Akkermansiaceae bacterium]